MRFFMNFSYKFPAVKGHQAGNDYYITMIPMGLLSKLFVNNGNDIVLPEFRAQRKLNEQRIPEIANYILDNRNSYVFSALSASIDGKFEFIPNDKMEELGVLEVDMNAVFLINDGQHRKAAIDKAILEDPTLEKETISIVLFKDEGLKRSQQMFTDLNKHAVKTSNSISTLYDGRDKIGVATSNIINKIPFFNVFTDKEKDNLGKNSSKLFTLNNLYKANKKIIKGEFSEEDEEFLFNYWKIISENILEWKEVMNKELTKKSLREDYIITLAVTIMAFGKLGSFLYENREYKLEDYLPRIKNINWSRTNDYWKNSIIREDGKVQNNEDASLIASIKIKSLIDLPLTKEELKKIK